jgi:hypothetical protein
LATGVVYGKTHFVSLLGEAANSTVVPYLAYLGKFGPPLSAVLLVTPQAAQWAPGIAGLIREVSPDLPVRRIDVASGLGDGEGDLPGVEATYRALEGSLGALAINMMGGAKRTLLGGLFALRGRDHIFLQLSEATFSVARMVGDTVHTESMALGARLPAKKCLDLQKIDYRPDPDPPWDLKGLCREARVPVPEGAMFNVTMAGNRVDCVWSGEGSVLSFLLISPNDGADGPGALANARHVETLASTKWWTNGLFSRRIFVLEGLSRNVARYESEIPGLVKSFRVDWSPARLTESARESLREIFAPAKPRPARSPIKRPTLDLEPVPTLVTAMGRMSDATLLAIVTHRLPQVVLVYTPEDEWVSHMARIYRDKARELGLRKVLALPTDYSAANLHAHLPASLAAQAVVNVTPGTKPQGLALGLWAKNHGVPSWAIEREVIRRLDREAPPVPVRGVNLKARLDFTLEIQVTDHGWGKHSPGWGDDALYRRLLEFMDLALGRDQAKNFHHRDLALGGYELSRLTPAQNDWRFSWPAHGHDPAGSAELRGGFWYERLTAKAVDALNSLGRLKWDVACGVEVSIPGSSRHLTERDVLAANSRAQLFMISCKTAGKLRGGALAAIVSEVEAMAKTLGRFVVPVLCHMAPDPPKTVGETLVIGWPTLCRPAELHSALGAAARALHG